MQVSYVFFVLCISFNLINGLNNDIEFIPGRGCGSLRPIKTLNFKPHPHKYQDYECSRFSRNAPPMECDDCPEPTTTMASTTTTMTTTTPTTTTTTTTTTTPSYPLTSSTEFSSDFALFHATDGDMTTSFKSNGSGGKIQWFQINFEVTKTVTGNLIFCFRNFFSVAL